MAAVLRATGELVDPHTRGRHPRSGGNAGAIRRRRWCASRPRTRQNFPRRSQRATGVAPALPARLADLHERAERFDVLPNELGAVKAHIQQAVMAEA